MTSHRYRKPGLHGATLRPNGTWQGQKNYEGQVWAIGTFTTPERASVAVRLFEHWIGKGFHVEDIPRQPRTIDAI